MSYLFYLVPFVKKKSRLNVHVAYQKRNLLVVFTTYQPTEKESKQDGRVETIAFTPYLN